MSIGYTDCPCRDCFEISMDHAMCEDCEEAGCTGEGDCLAPGAYEMDDEELRNHERTQMGC